MDLKGLAADIGLEEQDILELVELFYETSTSDLDRLIKAMDQNDVKTVAETAHSIKGVSRSLGGLVLGDIVLRLEELGREGKLERAPELANRIEAEFKRFAAYYADPARFRNVK